jgi:SAM-dependent methyltransferase
MTIQDPVEPDSFSSADYWEARYESGGGSGSGSRGHLARYKAAVLHRVMEQYSVEDVIDFGCGDGFQIDLLEIPRYTGIDVSETALTRCRARFADRPGWRFLPAVDEAAYAGYYRMAMSLDVICHLVEDAVFDGYMGRLFDHASAVVVIYATDASFRSPSEHLVHRPVSEWVATNRPDWRLAERLANPFMRRIEVPHYHGTTPAGFMIFEAAPAAIDQELPRG